jgi:hypothetical protein
MSEYGGWTSCVTDILEIAKLSFPIYPLLLPLNSLPLFYSHFAIDFDLTKAKDEDFWDTSIWTIHFEHEKDESPESATGSKGVIVARICSTGDAKVRKFPFGYLCE